jgi:hypothetical protein
VNWDRHQAPKGERREERGEERGERREGEREKRAKWMFQVV